MTQPIHSLRRILAIAGNTVREAVRQRLPYLLVLLAAGLLVGAHHLRELHFGSSELKFVSDLGFGTIALFGAVLAVVTTAQLFLGELERGTVLTLLAKPVGRAEFVLGKFAGVAVITAAFCTLLTLVLAVVIRQRAAALAANLPDAVVIGKGIDYGLIAWMGLRQWLALLVLSALTLFVASYARTPLFATVMGFALFVAGQLQHLAHAASVRAGHSLIALLWRLIPDFQTLGAGGGVLDATNLSLTAYGLAHVALACGLAIFVFQRREL
jgi:ABC-type transport system involved in multi-copper enzyme maturation permease subunit